MAALPETRNYAPAVPSVRGEEPLIIGLIGPPDEIERLEENIYPDPNSGCYIWAGPSDRRGYGVFRRNKDRRTLRPTRYIWAALGRALPPGAVLRHKCDTPSCVNPDHLELGTHQDNMIDMALRGRSRKGCVRRLPSGKYQARASLFGKPVSLGTYDTEAEAVAVARSAKVAGYGR